MFTIYRAQAQLQYFVS